MEVAAALLDASRRMSTGEKGSDNGEHLTSSSSGSGWKILRSGAGWNSSGSETGWNSSSSEVRIPCE